MSSEVIALNLAAYSPLPRFEEFSEAEFPAEGSEDLSRFFVMIENFETPRGETPQPTYRPYIADSLSNRLCRISNTAYYLLFGKVIDLPPPPHGLNLTPVACTWSMLVGSPVGKFLDGSAKETPFYTIHEFYISGRGVNKRSFDAVKKLIDIHLEALPKDLPLCIPLLFESEEFFGRNHLTVILVKDGIVEYFDSLAIPAKSRTIGSSGETLEKLLDYLRERMNAASIEENPIQLQWDAINCGVLVCHFLRRRLKKNGLMGEHLCVIPPGELELVRRKIAEIAVAEHTEQQMDEPSNRTFEKCPETGKLL